MIRVTNMETGESKDYQGKMMVASNGVIFIKKGNETIWASGHEFFLVEKI